LDSKLPLLSLILYEYHVEISFFNYYFFAIFLFSGCT